VSSNAEFVVNPQYSKTRRGAFQITLAPSRSRDWARLWPKDEGVSPLFRLVVLPLRLVSLVLLWATATPGRLLFATALGVFGAALLIR
jgi:hypothetical protein